MACPLHTCNSRWFPTFNGWELNWQFGHNLFVSTQFWSCEPILDIYVSRDFQWCEKLFNPMRFNPLNRFLKIWKPLGIPTPKVGAHLGVSGSPLGSVWAHSLTLSRIPRSVNVTFGLHSQPSPFHAPCIGYEPKVRVMTIWNVPQTTHAIVKNKKLELIKTCFAIFIHYT